CSILLFCLLNLNYDTCHSLQYMTFVVIVKVFYSGCLHFAKLNPIRCCRVAKISAQPANIRVPENEILRGGDNPMAFPALFASDQETMVVWIALGAICIVPSICFFLYQWRKSEMEIELKRDMVARGMSVEEIERVLAAGGPAPKSE